MINFIVSLFRAAIGFLFIALLFVVFSMFSVPGAGGPFGAVMGVGILLAGVMSLGIAATLISINDNLSRLGGVPKALEASAAPVEPIDPVERKAMADRQRKNTLIALGAAVLILIAIQLSSRFSAADAPRPDDTTESTSNSFYAEGYDPKDPECVPELAESIGESCE